MQTVYRSLCVVVRCRSICHTLQRNLTCTTAMISQTARIMGSTWGPTGPCRPQMGPMLAPWTLLSGMIVSVPVNQPAMTWVNTSREPTKSKSCNHNESKQKHSVYISQGVYVIYPPTSPRNEISGCIEISLSACPSLYPSVGPRVRSVGVSTDQNYHLT